MVYKAIVIPFVEFGNGLLLGCTELELNKIQRTQNKGLKIALNRGRLCRTSILHADARLAEWRCALIALNKVMFKFKEEPDFTGQVRDRPNTRLTEGTTMYLNRPRNNAYLNSISYIGRSGWNGLPASLRNLSDLNVFGRSVKKIAQ